MNGSPKDEAVTAKLIFIGVMIACINRKGQYEVGLVVCPEHEPKITVWEIENGNSTELAPIVWPHGHDLQFKVINPDVEGVSKHPTTRQDTSFHRVLDMEGFLLHRGRVTVNPQPLQGRRLAVTAGRLYTHKLSAVPFDLLTWTDRNARGTIAGHIGRIAEQVGLNILCRNEAGSGIQLLDLETGDEICSMPAVAGKAYKVLIENDCSRNPGSDAQVGTDFRYFYEQGFVTSSDGLKFDLSYETSSGPQGPPASPDACENTFLGNTDSLGIKTEWNAADGE